MKSATSFKHISTTGTRDLMLFKPQSCYRLSTNEIIAKFYMDTAHRCRHPHSCDPTYTVFHC